MTTARIAEQLRVNSRVVAGVGALIDHLPAPSDALCWVNGGEGIVGWGELARMAASGPLRFTKLDSWWRSYSSRMVVHDEVRLPGTGPVAFTSIAFADEPGRSVLVVPRVVMGRRNGVTWLTWQGGAEEPTEVLSIGSPGRVRYADGQLSVSTWRNAVAGAVTRMRSGELAKVVLAHDVVAATEYPVDPRYLLGGLAANYPSCWVFSVDGMVGATPELLVRRLGQQVDARVLAGTVWPHDGLADSRLAAELLASPKNRAEHAYAVQSMVEALRPFCSPLQVPSGPSVLRLHNVQHLATEIRGRLTGGQSVLRLAWLAHPTAAVGGTPAPDACRLINELERMDRGRYAGPVGWVDAAGNGELGIALRCAEVEGRSVRLFAGCGIVADSDPDVEVREAAAKLVPIRDALEGVVGGPS
ncbi:MAG TPA: isochorismate synthase [Pseudonocardiaceae bacterium]